MFNQIEDSNTYTPEGLKELRSSTGLRNDIHQFDFITASEVLFYEVIEDSESGFTIIHSITKESYDDGDVVLNETYETKTNNLVVEAEKVTVLESKDGRSQESETATMFGVIFHDGDGDFSKLTGKGMFAATKEVLPFIAFIDKQTSGNWYASCDDKKRMKVYERWLPKEKIICE